MPPIGRALFKPASSVGLKEACRLVRERVLDEFPPEIRARLGSVMYEHDWSGLSKTESESHYGRL